MLRILIATLLAILVVAATAAAETTPTQPTTEPTSSTTTTTTPSTTATSNEGVFAKLSPGNQKIARALFEAQQSSGTSTTSTQPMTEPTSSTTTTQSTTTTSSGSSSTTSKTLSLDDIAAMKQSGKGWGEVFQEMKAQGLIQAKNLGQLVSRANHQAHNVQAAASAQPMTEPTSSTATTSKSFRAKGPKDGTLITTGSGRSHLVGARTKPEWSGQHGGRHVNSGQGNVSRGSGHDFHGGDKSLSSASSGRSSRSGHGGKHGSSAPGHGRGK